MSLLTDFLAQLAKVQDVWMPFLIAVAIVGIAVWKFSASRYADRISTLEHRIQLRDDTITRFEREARPPKATPRKKTTAAAEPLASPEAQTLLKAAEARENRVFVQPSVTPVFLRNLYEGRTDIQADKMAQSYLGLWMDVSVTVTAVMATYGNRIMIRGYDGKHKEPVNRMMNSISFTFEGDRESLEILREGDRIRVVGRIERIASHLVSLDDCELIKAE